MAMFCNIILQRYNIKPPMSTPGLAPYPNIATFAYYMPMLRKYTCALVLPGLLMLMAACGGNTPIADKPANGTAANQTVPPTFSGVYSGLLKGDTLVLNIKVQDKVVSGAYFIKGREDTVGLSGTLLANDSAEVYEFAPGGEKGGVFKGLFKGTDLFTGNWKPISGGAAQPFSFNKTTLQYNPALYAVNDTLAFTLTKKVKENKAARCKATIEYPLFANPDKLSAIDKINAAIKKYFEATLTDCDGLERDEFTQSQSDYESEAIGNVMYNKYGIVGVNMGWYNYLGGAHPNHGANSYYFEVATGRELKLIDLVQQANLPKLSALALAQFKKDRKVKKATDGGLYDETITLKGTESFYLGDTTLTLGFSPYEIAPYVVGDIEITLGFSKIKPLVAERSAFKKVVR